MPAQDIGVSFRSVQTGIGVVAIALGECSAFRLNAKGIRQCPGRALLYATYCLSIATEMSFRLRIDWPFDGARD